LNDGEKSASKSSIKKRKNENFIIEIAWDWDYTK